MLHITFNSINSNRACEEGYEPLSDALGGDSNYGMDKPISLLKCLESNPIEDVLWALRATLEDSKEFYQKFAVACAEHGLPIFEEKYPEDKRPRLALEAAKSGKLTKEILDAAADAASAYAYCTAAAAAAAAYYAATAAAAWSAATNYAATNYAEEKQWQKELLIKMLNEHKS